MLIVCEWVGRLGNNILQLIRAIYYAKRHGHYCIKFNKHPFLTDNKIVFSDNRNTNNVSNTFFYMKKLNMTDPELILMKQYFQEYIKPIFKIKCSETSNNDLYIHFRGGDIFSSNPHSSYVQPPLIYYKNIIEKYDNIKLVCQDNGNPCISQLVNLPNIEYISNSLEKDLTILAHASHLVIGFGTFGLLVYFLNTNLKTLYIPKYFIEQLPKGSWGNHIKIHIVDLPNYIKVGNWKNTKEQQRFMLEYK